MDRVLTLEFVRVTETAAVKAGRLMGKGDKMGADQLAVDGMHSILSTVPIDGTVVIGEGEMDEAPMLYIGEKVGAGGTEVDIAIDPLEGTNLTAKGQDGSIAVMAIARKGNLLHAPDMYMEKLCVGPRAKGRIDLTQPVQENLRRIAEGLERGIDDLTVVILDRPRHQEIIDECRSAGARIKLITDGDVSPAVDAGIQGAMNAGVVAGFPVVDVKVTLYDGSYHEVDSSEMPGRRYAGPPHSLYRRRTEALLGNGH